MVMLTQALYLLKMKRMIHLLTYEPKGYLLIEVSTNRIYNFSANTLLYGWRHLVVRSSVGQTEFYIDGAYQDEVNAHINLDIGTLLVIRLSVAMKFAPKDGRLSSL